MFSGKILNISWTTRLLIAPHRDDIFRRRVHSFYIYDCTAFHVVVCSDLSFFLKTTKYKQVQTDCGRNKLSVCYLEGSGQVVFYFSCHISPRVKFIVRG